MTPMKWSCLRGRGWRLHASQPWKIVDMIDMRDVCDYATKVFQANCPCEAVGLAEEEWAEITGLDPDETFGLGRHRTRLHSFEAEEMKS